MASRFRQAHNAFDTGRISHPVGWTSGPLDDWHQYARDDFTRKAEWQQNMDKHGRADKGRALLGQDTQKLIVNSLSDNRVAVFDKELHMTIPRFFGHQPNRGALLAISHSAMIEGNQGTDRQCLVQVRMRIWSALVQSVHTTGAPL